MPRYQVRADYPWVTDGSNGLRFYNAVVEAENGDRARTKALFEGAIPARIIRDPLTDQPVEILWSAESPDGWPTVVDSGTLSWGDGDDLQTLWCRAQRMDATLSDLISEMVNY